MPIVFVIESVFDNFLTFPPGYQGGIRVRRLDLRGKRIEDRDSEKYIPFSQQILSLQRILPNAGTLSYTLTGNGRQR